MNGIFLLYRVVTSAHLAQHSYFRAQCRSVHGKWPLRAAPLQISDASPDAILLPTPDAIVSSFPISVKRKFWINPLYVLRVQRHPDRAFPREMQPRVAPSPAGVTGGASRGPRPRLPAGVAEGLVPCRFSQSAIRTNIPGEGVPVPCRWL